MRVCDNGEGDLRRYWFCQSGSDQGPRGYHSFRRKFDTVWALYRSMESLQDKVVSFSSDVVGHTSPPLELSSGGILASVWQATGGSGELIENRLTRQWDNDSFLSRRRS